MRKIYIFNALTHDLSVDLLNDSKPWLGSDWVKIFISSFNAYSRLAINLELNMFTKTAM